MSDGVSLGTLVVLTATLVAVLLYAGEARKQAIAMKQQAEATRRQADASSAMVREMKQERYHRARDDHRKQLEAYVYSMHDDLAAFAYGEQDYQQRELRESLLHHYPALALAADEGSRVLKELASALDVIEANANRAAVANGYLDSQANELIGDHAKRLALTFQSMADTMTVDYNLTSGWIQMGEYKLVDRHFSTPSPEELAEARRQIVGVLRECNIWPAVTEVSKLQQERAAIEAQFRKDKAKIATRIVHTLGGLDCEHCPPHPVMLLADL